MAGLLIAAYCIWIAPLRLVWALAWPGGGSRTVLRVWGIALPFRRRRRKGKRGGPGLRALLPLLRYVRVRRLEIALNPGGDAAAAALAAGLLRALAGAFPGIPLRCGPAFGGPGGVRVLCILEARLGMIGTAALLRRRRKEAGAWSIPSGN